MNVYWFVIDGLFICEDFYVINEIIDLVGFIVNKGGEVDFVCRKILFKKLSGVVNVC